jgi:hypothetical protein
MGRAKIPYTAKENTKKFNETRCSETADVILELKEGYDEIKNALLDIATAGNESLMQRLT